MKANDAFFSKSVCQQSTNRPTWVK